LKEKIIQVQGLWKLFLKLFPEPKPLIVLTVQPNNSHNSPEKKYWRTFFSTRGSSKFFRGCKHKQTL